MRNISEKQCRKNQSAYLSLNNFYSECPKVVLCEIMWGKNGRARQATDDNIIRRMRFACWITKATDAHLLLFHGNNGYTNAPQCYVIRTLPVLFSSYFATEVFLFHCGTKISDFKLEISSSSFSFPSTSFSAGWIEKMHVASNCTA
jgi:hypothetical protein